MKGRATMRGVGVWWGCVKEGVTLREGLMRRVTINDCEMRIRGGSVSVQRGKEK